MAGEAVLLRDKWEQYAKLVAGGTGATAAYMRVYEIADRKAAAISACRFGKNAAIQDRIEYLKQRRAASDKNGIDLRSVIDTCKEVIETSESTPQRLKAIEVLNKLKIFDGEKNEDRPMDPAAICEYLAGFAGLPGGEISKVPGGLAGMVKRLMDLTGAKKEEIRDALDGVKTVVATDVENNGEKEDEEEADDDEKSDPFFDEDEIVDDGTLVETMKANVSKEDQELSEAMKIRLKPALEYCAKKREPEKIEF